MDAMDLNVSSAPSVTELESRRKRAIFRAWHRGTREVDLLLGPFASAFAPTMAGTDLATFEELLHRPDPDIFGWIVEGREPETPELRPLIQSLRRFHAENGAITGTGI
jgi:antitoxin CptB